MFAYPNNKSFSATRYRLTEHSSERLESSFMEYHNPTLRVLRILELIDANSGGLSLSAAVVKGLTMEFEIKNAGFR